jgi:hypothetical protein
MDEAMRFRIHGRFEEQLGTEEAAAVMTALSQASSVDERFDRLEEKLDRMAAELRSEINQLYRWTVGSIFAAVSLGAAVTRLAG